MCALFAVPANQFSPLKTVRQRRQRRHTPRAFCLNFGFFAFQFAVNARVQWEEGRKKSDEEDGKKQRERLNSESHGADCCPRWAWPCSVTSRCWSPIRRPLQASGFFLPSLIPYSLPHPVVFSYCSSFSPSSPLPSYLFTSLSLSLSPPPPPSE